MTETTPNTTVPAIPESLKYSSASRFPNIKNPIANTINRQINKYKKIMIWFIVFR